MRNSIKIFFCGLLGVAAVSCSDSEPAVPDTGGDVVARSYPMRYSGGVGFDSGARSDEYVWPDGAILMITGTGHAVDASKDVYATYSTSDGWTVYNYDGTPLSKEPCQVYYQEHVREPAGYTGIYDATGAYYRTQAAATFTFANGIFDLTALLKPVSGRVRFVSESEPEEVKYNFAKYSMSGSTSQDNFGYETETMQFHQEDDGKWYSDYIYTTSMPNLKIGSYVYKFDKKSTLSAGESGFVAIPADDDYANWTREEYQYEEAGAYSYSGSYSTTIYLPSYSFSSDDYSYISNIACVTNVDFYVWTESTSTSVYYDQYSSYTSLTTGMRQTIRAYKRCYGTAIQPSIRFSGSGSYYRDYSLQIYSFTISNF
ncbi:MAG: hypothetical protein Q4F07_03765 [Bacteroidales bacterium]|nr:hypothetical protein [Bacteroidales bacterium]